MEDPFHKPSPPAIESALRDLRNRTLAKLDGDFARLIYLASTRDYSTGSYAHDGLSFRFTPSVVNWVLATAHREIFISLALNPIKKLVDQLQQYLRSGGARPGELVATWNALEVYRILAPIEVDPLTVKLFISNVRVALAIVGSSLTAARPKQRPQSAWQQL